MCFTWGSFQLRHRPLHNLVMPKAKSNNFRQENSAENPHLKTDLLETFVKHIQDYGSKISSGAMHATANALVQIILVQDITMRSDIIRVSFNKTGIYPYDICKILGNFKVKVNNALENSTSIVSKMPIFSEKIRERGEIMDRELEEEEEEEEGCPFQGLKGWISFIEDEHWCSHTKPSEEIT